MARVNKAVLGFISGKLGDVVFREMNGKKFVSVSAKKYKISQSAEAKEGRANFAAAVKLAKTVNSIAALKEIWTSAKTDGTNSYHKIIKSNAKRVTGGNLTTANKITPDGLPLTLSSAEIQNNKLELSFSFPSDEVSFPAELCIIFYFNKDIIHNQITKIEAAEPDDLYYLNLNLTPEIISALSEFPNPVVYFAVAGQPVKNKIYWASTAPKKM